MISTLRLQALRRQARELATVYQHPEVLPTHLLYAVLRDGEGVASAILDRLEVDIDGMLQGLSSGLDSENSLLAVSARPQASRSSAALLRDAARIARDRRDDQVGSEHLLLALTRERRLGVGRWLEAFGVTADHVAEEADCL